MAKTMFIKLFNNAGATGHVFLLRGGKLKDKGIAYSGFVGPLTTVAVVPTTERVLDFTIEARTRDNQDVQVKGNIKVGFIPTTAVSKLDFTVDVDGGSYVNAWEQVLRAIVVEKVLTPVRAFALTVGVELATKSQAEFEAAVRSALDGANNPLTGKGVVLQSCSIVSVETCDEDVGKAIGAGERQEMLAAADKALHDRRLKAATNERAVRTYEAQTAVKLEEERTTLLARQAENKKVEATADAEATKIRLEPLAKVDGGKILGAALMEMAKSGRVGSLSIVPELLAALKQ